ncbi:MAG: phosphoglycerate dehydrogenase [Planctomycetes bacterium]|nr:phosphoglycerate dehydrogenase [Planctomycetota bacterium]
MSKKVLITSGPFDRALASEGSGYTKVSEMLTAAGLEIVRMIKREARDYSLADFEGKMDGIHAVIAGSEPWNEALFKISPDLKIISRYGVGYDAVDLAKAKEYGIMVTNTRVIELSRAVGEAALTLTLSVLRHVPAMCRDLKSGTWQGRPGLTLIGKTVGIVGFGAIGQSFARLLAGFNCRILACDPYVTQETADTVGATMTDLDHILAESDVVSIHAPNLKENYHLINAETIGKMKKEAVLINTARGPLVDEKALYEALASGHLYGAGLDVWETEPTPASNPLLGLDNVVAQPHVAGETRESATAIAECDARQVIDALSGLTPQYLLNP